MNHRDLEQELHEAIQRCCSTEEDEEKAKRYFYSVLVNDMIDEALE
jgi:hypothetical protein